MKELFSKLGNFLIIIIYCGLFLFGLYCTFLLIVRAKMGVFDGTEHQLVNRMFRNIAIGCFLISFFLRSHLKISEQLKRVEQMLKILEQQIPKQNKEKPLE